MSESIEVIRHAAIRSKTGMIILGKSHADCFHTLKNIGDAFSQKVEDQGFMTSHGRYVSRELAADLALKARQIETPTIMLFSEDLWSKNHGGRFNYCSIRGYYE